MHRPRVLLVEDNLLLRWWMMADLSRAGFFVAAPSSVDDALHMAARVPFDVLVTDWHLAGGRNGFEVLQEVRRRFPETTAVLISADADAELTRRALRAGFHFVVQKPFASATMIELVRGVTESQHGALRSALADSGSSKEAAS